MSEQTYVSPLMARIRDEETLSLETLAKYVPAAQASLAAMDDLRENGDSYSAEKVSELKEIVRNGDSAKERLVLISMPLIKSLARKEFVRRQSWNSRVTMEDIVSEGMSGFMRGIRAYNVDGNQHSPTNYLGQWILTDMRRNSENMDHDFSVPYEAVERTRRIRAIRSRLTHSLGREPTNQEIVDASNDGVYKDGSMMGRVDKRESASSSSNRRGLTVKRVEEERAMSDRTGVVKSVHATLEDQTPVEETALHSVYGDDDTPLGDIERIDDQSAKRALTSLLEDSFNVMNVGGTQRDIIRRRFGLLPYGEEATIKEIIAHTGIPKHRVNRVLSAYAAQMTTKSGFFHQILSTRGFDEVEGMGIGWVSSLLGKFELPLVTDVNDDLVIAIGRPKEHTRARLSSNLGGAGVVAYFECPRHSDMLFTDVYVSASAIPITRACPMCGKQSPRITD